MSELVNKTQKAYSELLFYITMEFVSRREEQPKSLQSLPEFGSKEEITVWLQEHPHADPKLRKMAEIRRDLWREPKIQETMPDEPMFDLEKASDGEVSAKTSKTPPEEEQIMDGDCYNAFLEEITPDFTTSIIGGLKKSVREELASHEDECDPQLGKNEQREPFEISYESLMAYAEEVGAGACGTVYIAEDPATGKKYLIKRAHPNTTGGLDFQKMLKREAEVYQRLKGKKHFYDLLTTGENEDGLNYFICQYPEKTLSWQEIKGGCSRGQISNMVTELAEAYREAHEKGVIHGDPAIDAVRFIPDERELCGYRVLLTDFSLAVLEGEEQEDDYFQQKFQHSLSLSLVQGVRVGQWQNVHPDYMNERKVRDRQYDIAGFGMMAKMMLTGNIVGGQQREYPVIEKTLHADLKKRPSCMEEVILEVHKTKKTAYLNRWISEADAEGLGKLCAYLQENVRQLDSATIAQLIGRLGDLDAEQQIVLLDYIFTGKNQEETFSLLIKNYENGFSLGEGYEERKLLAQYLIEVLSQWARLDASYRPDQHQQQKQSLYAILYRALDEKPHLLKEFLQQLEQDFKDCSTRDYKHSKADIGYVQDTLARAGVIRKLSPNGSFPSEERRIDEQVRKYMRSGSPSLSLQAIASSGIIEDRVLHGEAFGDHQEYRSEASQTLLQWMLINPHDALVQRVCAECVEANYEGGWLCQELEEGYTEEKSENRKRIFSVAGPALKRRSRYWREYYIGCLEALEPHQLWFEDEEFFLEEKGEKIVDMRVFEGFFEGYFDRLQQQSGALLSVMDNSVISQFVDISEHYLAQRRLGKLPDNPLMMDFYTFLEEKRKVLGDSCVVIPKREVLKRLLEEYQMILGAEKSLREGLINQRGNEQLENLSNITLLTREKLKELFRSHKVTPTFMMVFALVQSGVMAGVGTDVILNIGLTSWWFLMGVGSYLTIHGHEEEMIKKDQENT